MGVDQRRLSRRSIIEHGARRARSSRPSNARVNLATALLGGARWRASPTQARQPFLTGTMRNTMLVVYVELRCRSALLWAEWNIGVIFFLPILFLFVRLTNYYRRHSTDWSTVQLVSTRSEKPIRAPLRLRSFPTLPLQEFRCGLHWRSVTASSLFRKKERPVPPSTPPSPLLCRNLTLFTRSFKLKCQVSFDKAACTRSFKLYNTIRLSYCHVMSIQLHWECFVVPRTLITHLRQS